MSYAKVLKISKVAAIQESISSLCGWDQETYMPDEGIILRSQQIELLAGMVHKERTSKKFAAALGKLIDLETGQILDQTLTPAQRAAAREWRRDYIKAVKLPPSFVKQFAQVTSASIHAWRTAKEGNNFSQFLPHLKKVVALCRKKADILGYSEHPYDALVDLYEPEMKTSTIEALLGRLKIPLIALFKAVHAKPQPKIDFLNAPYGHNEQLKFANRVLHAMGFRKEFSRLDESSHPMSISLHPQDVRMTTRVYPHNPLPNILSAIHEGGHALYSHNLPPAEFGSPLGEPSSLGINESQSRMWETIIGRGLPFWQHFYPLLQEAFSHQLAGVSLEDFYRAVNLVKPTMIRVDADEVTYNLHIMIRFELEKALLDESLEAKDLPGAWNEKMRLYLGINPASDTEGCLQDIHWSMGGIGYFPTYTLGNLYSAQFFETFKEKHPHWAEKVSKGDLSQLGHWLSQEIHRFGREYIPEDLCKKVTGKPLSEKPFISYLEQKYKGIYHLA